jgi:hypothetical protein
MMLFLKGTGYAGKISPRFGLYKLSIEGAGEEIRKDERSTERPTSAAGSQVHL